MNDKTTLKNVSDRETSRFLRNVAIGLAVVIVFLSLPNLCSSDCGHDHGHHDHEHHDHEHIDEPASFKWTRQANEAERLHHEQTEDHKHGHGHHHHEHAHHTEPNKKVAQGQQ